MKNIELIDKAIDELINWPSNEPEETHLHQFNSGRFVAGISGGSTPAPFCTRAEFEARKAERQNKPDWSECHDWSMFMVQDRDGFWYVTSQKPTATDLGWDPSSGRWAASDLKGEVIGDWRDTLEQRPNHIGEANEKDVEPEWPDEERIDIIGPNGNDGLHYATKAPEFKHGAGVFNLVDDDWHARGELPPVSTQCEWKGLNGGYWVQCEVIDKYQDKEMVVFNTGEYRNGRYEILKLDSVEFRPLRTEREKFVEAAIRVGELRARDGAVEVYGRLFDAGFRAPESK